MSLVRASLSIALLGGLTLLSAPASAQAQAPARYYPLQAPIPPGMAGDWAVKRGKGGPVCFQRIRVELPDSGHAVFFDGAPDREIALSAPAQVGLLVGPVYRFKISDMPDYPGVELYPTVELVDRLHPPEGRAADFPVPIRFTAEDIEFALQGRLVTKVVYLEQPNRALPIATGPGNPLPPKLLPPRENTLQAADLRGRPMLIIRLGGRTPDPQNEQLSFYGSLAPVEVPPQPALGPAAPVDPPADPEPPAAIPPGEIDQTSSR
jgi:hypothetical protein